MRTAGADDWRPLAGCHGKKVYQTFTQAKQAALRHRKRGKNPYAVEPYRCKHCQKFHLTGKQ